MIFRGGGGGGGGGGTGPLPPFGSVHALSDIQMITSNIVA